VGFYGERGLSCENRAFGKFLGENVFRVKGVLRQRGFLKGPRWEESYFGEENVFL
jgi:hypothetical protein